MVIFLIKNHPFLLKNKINRCRCLASVMVIILGTGENVKAVCRFPFALYFFLAVWYTGNKKVKSWELQGADMEKIITIFDWWDGPLCGLTTFQESVCIYERIFDEDKDDWSDEYYLTPIDENSADLLLKDWNIWCKAIQTEDFLKSYSSATELCHNIIESSSKKRTYKKTAVFNGCFGKGFVPIDYRVEWI